MHYKKKLHPKLKTYSASALISGFGKHFDITTHVANDQTDTYVQQINAAFGEVKYLSPLGYFDSKGNNVTSQVRKEKRPENLAYMLVEASIPLQDLHRVFTSTDVFTHQYYLPLPQSYKVMPAKPALSAATLA